VEDRPIPEAAAAGKEFPAVVAGVPPSGGLRPPRPP